VTDDGITPLGSGVFLDGCTNVAVPGLEVSAWLTRLQIVQDSRRLPLCQFSAGTNTYASKPDLVLMKFVIFYTQTIGKSSVSCIFN